MIRAEIADGNIRDILEKFLSSGVMEDGKRTPTLRGTPQGEVISPLIANIVFNYLDWQLAAQQNSIPFEMKDELLQKNSKEQE